MVSIEEPKFSGLRLGFIIAYEESPYEGVVRPFINWAKELKRRGLDVSVILYRTGDKILNSVEGLKLEHHIVSDLKELRGILRDNNYSYVFTDDYIGRLRLADIITQYSRLIIYAQVLFGIHAVSPVFKYSAIPLNYRLLYAIAGMIPFSLIRSRYSEKLLKADIVIANSETTRTLLYSLYGIIAQEVVYPPVDTEIFKPLNTPKKNQVVLYLGSPRGGDTDPRLLEKICKILRERGTNVVMFGNARLARSIIANGCKAEHISGLSDMELARLYSESIATIAPQLWEQFGYVIAESIACGTPVIAFASMGPEEIVSMTGLGFLAKSEIEFLKMVKNITSYTNSINNKLHGKSKKLNLHELPFSSKISTYKLLGILQELDYRGIVTD